MAPRSFYDVLGVSADATTDQIRVRFKQLARQLHPDRFSGTDKQKAELEFQALTQAFNILSDPTRRREHDFELAQPQGTKAQDVDRLSDVYLRRGLKAVREKRWAEAAESFRRATEAQPRNARAWFQLARACSSSRRWQKQAVEASARACELEPMNLDYLKLAAKIHQRAGLNTKALSFYTEVLHWGGADPAIEQALEELKASRSG